MRGVVLRLGGRTAALEADSSAGSFAVASSHGNEFHEVERDVFIAARAKRKTGHFHDKNSSVNNEIRRVFRPHRDHSRTTVDQVTTARARLRLHCITSTATSRTPPWHL